MAPPRKVEAARSVGHADPMLTRPYQVQRISRETVDTFTLELKSRESRNGLSFAPGQFNMLYVFGAGEAPISISGDPTRASLLVHTTRAVGAVTKAMVKLKIGDALGVRGPFGSNWPVEPAAGHDVVIVAGGIGLAPLRPVIYYLLANREKYGKVVLLYGARTPEDMLYRRSLERWRARLDLEVYLTVDRATGSWRGNIGVVTTLMGRLAVDPLHSYALVCGPEVMMRFTVIELQKRGVPDNRIIVSLERNMKCGIGLCGHCQLGPTFVCKDGPVYAFDRVRELLIKREL